MPNLSYSYLMVIGLSLALGGSAVPGWSAPAATTTTLTVASGGSAVTSVTSGTAVTLAAAVAVGATPVTVGQVDFCDAIAAHCEDIHLLGTAQLSTAGTARFKFIPGPGSHSYKAVFVGTTNDASSSSPSMALTVTGRSPTATNIAQSGSPGNYTLTAAVGSAGVASPTGLVSFLDTSNGNATLGTATLGAEITGPNLFNVSNPATGPNPGSIAAGDFNGDGIPDLAVVDQDSNTVTILLGNGDGTFTAASASPATGQNPSTVAIGDFNGDGIPDLAVVNNLAAASGISTVTILLGNGDGTFTAVAASPAIGSASLIAVGDFNRDGIPDLVAYGDDAVTILLGNGNGTFATVFPSPTTGGAHYIAVGDLNGDGIPDLAIVTGSGTVTILLGNGNGTFTAASTSPAVGPYAGSIAVGDFNRDGIPDLAVSEGGSYAVPAGVTILLGNGDGTFTVEPTIPTAFVAGESIAVGDFNGDGIPDLALANVYIHSGGNSVTILVGKGDGTFTAASAGSPEGNASFIAVGDFNGDGIPDLAIPNVPDPDAITMPNSVTILLAVPESTTATATGINLPVATGTQQVVASYAGDNNFEPSISTSTALTAAQGTPSVGLAQSSSTVSYGTPVTFTATITGSGLTPTGTVTFVDGVLLLGTGTLNSSGVATYTTSSIAVGLHSITVSFAGDSNYTSATSTVLSLTVNVGAPTASLTASSTTITYGATVTLTAKLAGGGATPTGTVTFLNGSSALGSSSLNGSGVATYATTALPVGNNSITASYSGDSNYSPETPAAIAVTVMPPGFALANSGNITVSPGATTGNTSTIIVTPSGGFTGAVALTCAIAPVAASDPAACALSPASVTISGTTAVTSTLTLSTTAATTAALAHPRAGKAPWYAAGGALACVLLFVVPTRKPRLRTMLGVIVVFALVVESVASCGGGSGGGGGGANNSGTTAGTYVVTVTGTAGSITGTTTVTLTVNYGSSASMIQSAVLNCMAGTCRVGRRGESRTIRHAREARLCCCQALKSRAI